MRPHEAEKTPSYGHSDSLQNGENNHYILSKGLVFKICTELKTQHQGNKYLNLKMGHRIKQRGHKR